jgi:hypothetical protein
MNHIIPIIPIPPMHRSNVSNGSNVIHVIPALSKFPLSLVFSKRTCLGIQWTQA